MELDSAYLGGRIVTANKKKILFFSAFFPPYRGGAEVFMEEVGKRLAKTHEVTVLTARLSSALAEEERVNGMHIIRLGFGGRLDKWLYPFLVVLKSFSISHDIVYGVLESYAGFTVALYKLFHSQRPAILNLQSGTLDDWRRGFGLNLLFRRWIHLAPDAIHAISKHLADRAKKFGAKNIVVIPNGIDLAKFTHLPKPLLREEGIERKIICVGRLYYVKGQDILLEAIPAVLKEFPDVKLHLIGDGPENERLTVQSEKLKVDGSVIFRGNLSHDEIPKEIASAAILVGPSRREGQGIAFVEAMAVGCPVIGTNVGGIPEVIEHGVTGLLVPPENPQALAEAILKLFRDPAYAGQLVENARKRVGKYDWNDIAPKVDQLISSISIKK